MFWFLIKLLPVRLQFVLREEQHSCDDNSENSNRNNEMRQNLCSDMKDHPYKHSCDRSWPGISPVHSNGFGVGQHQVFAVNEDHVNHASGWRCSARTPGKT